MGFHYAGKKFAYEQLTLNGSNTHFQRVVYLNILSQKKYCVFKEQKKKPLGFFGLVRRSFCVNETCHIFDIIYNFRINVQLIVLFI